MRFGLVFGLGRRRMTTTMQWCIYECVMNFGGGNKTLIPNREGDKGRQRDLYRLERSEKRKETCIKRAWLGAAQELAGIRVYRDRHGSTDYSTWGKWMSGICINIVRCSADGLFMIYCLLLLYIGWSH